MAGGDASLFFLRGWWKVVTLECSEPSSLIDLAIPSLMDLAIDSLYTWLSSFDNFFFYLSVDFLGHFLWTCYLLDLLFKTFEILPSTLCVTKPRGHHSYFFQVPCWMCWGGKKLHTAPQLLLGWVAFSCSCTYSFPLWWMSLLDGARGDTGCTIDLLL